MALDIFRFAVFFFYPNEPKHIVGLVLNRTLAAAQVKLSLSMGWAKVDIVNMVVTYLKGPYFP